jgi:2-polyprenyl-3-methyl-5-hydroxy-6-metoxy-1,4-benzoquinol methylase
MIPSYEYPDVVRNDILQMIPSDGQVIGSIGCGWAATEAILVQQGRQVHGVDVCAQAIEVAATRLTSARLVEPKTSPLFPPDSLDGLILADVIEHIPSAWLALAEFARCVRPGGWIIISVPNMRSIHTIREWWIGGDWPERPYGIFDATHLQVMSKKRLVRWCDGAGLQVERWFDKYKEDRRQILHLLDLATFRCFHFWLTFQLQVRCRRGPKGASLEK